MTSITQWPMVGGTSTTEGLVSYVVDGAWPPFLGLATVTNGATVRYVATDGTQFEEGYGVKSNGPTLTRSSILRTSAGDTDKIDWGTGTRVVYVVPDIDTVYEADDGAFVRFLKAPQVASDDAGTVNRQFRWWTTTGVMYLSVASESPFVHLLRYDPAAATPTLELDEPTNFGGTVSIGGNEVTSVATSPFASQAEAETGTSESVVMNPARTANAIADADLLIGNRTYRPNLAYTDEFVGNFSGGLYRSNLSQIDVLFNTPDYESLGNALNAGPVVKTHGLGTKPKRVRYALTCISDDEGHASGDSITDLAWQTEGDNADGVAVVVNATQIKFLFKGLRIIRPDNTGPALIDLAKWQVDIWAWVGGAAP